MNYFSRMFEWIITLAFNMYIFRAIDIFKDYKISRYNFVIIMIEILCINKDDRNNPYERITHIGWKDNNWKLWKITQKEAIDWIKSGKWSFFVSKNWNTVKVIVSISRYGNEYIKTESDWDEPNNLLSLSECTL